MQNKSLPLRYITKIQIDWLMVLGVKPKQIEGLSKFFMRSHEQEFLKFV